MKVHVNNKKLILFLVLMLFFSKSAKTQNNKQQSKKTVDTIYQMSKFSDQVYDLVIVQCLNKLLELLPDCTNTDITYSQKLQQLERYRSTVYDSCIRAAYPKIDSLRAVWGVPVSVANNEYNSLRVMANQMIIEPFWYRDYYNVLQNLGQQRSIPVYELNGMLDAVRLNIFQLNIDYNDLPQHAWIKIKNKFLDCVAAKDPSVRCQRLQQYPGFLKSVLDSVNRSGDYDWAIKWYTYYMLQLWYLCGYHFGCIQSENLLPQQNVR